MLHLHNKTHEHQEKKYFGFRGSLLSILFRSLNSFIPTYLHRLDEDCPFLFIALSVLCDAVFPEMAIRHFVSASIGPRVSSGGGYIISSAIAHDAISLAICHHT